MPSDFLGLHAAPAASRSRLAVVPLRPATPQHWAVPRPRRLHSSSRWGADTEHRCHLGRTAATAPPQLQRFALILGVVTRMSATGPAYMGIFYGGTLSFCPNPVSVKSGQPQPLRVKCPPWKTSSHSSEEPLESRMVCKIIIQKSSFFPSATAARYSVGVFVSMPGLAGSLS